MQISCGKRGRVDNATQSMDNGNLLVIIILPSFDFIPALDEVLCYIQHYRPSHSHMNLHCLFQS